MLRCCWCGAKFQHETDLNSDEHGEPSYCLICGHDQFDDRYISCAMSSKFLKARLVIKSEELKTLLT